MLFSLLLACGDTQTQETPQESATQNSKPPAENTATTPKNTSFDPVALQKMASTIYQPLPATLKEHHPVFSVLD